MSSAAELEAAATAIFRFITWNMRSGGSSVQRTFPELTVPMTHVGQLPAGAAPQERWNQRWPAQLLGHGYGACSSQSYIIWQLAAAAGIPARLRQFHNPEAPGYGHTIVELGYGEGWHAFDPLYRLAFRLPGGSVADFPTLYAHLDAVARRYSASGDGPYWATGQPAAEAYAWRTEGGPSDQPLTVPPSLDMPHLSVHLGASDSLTFLEEPEGPPADADLSQPYSSALLSRALLDTLPVRVSPERPVTYTVTTPLPPAAQRVRLHGTNGNGRLSLQFHLLAMDADAAEDVDMYAPPLRTEFALWRQTRQADPLRFVLDAVRETVTPGGLRAWYEMHIYAPAMVEAELPGVLWWELWSTEASGPFAVDVPLPELLRSDMAYTLRLSVDAAEAHVTKLRLDQWLHIASSMGPWPEPGTQTYRIYGTRPAHAQSTPQLELGWESVARQPDMDKSDVYVGEPASANGFGAVLLRVRLRDAKGEPVRGHPVRLHTAEPGARIDQVPTRDRGPGTPSALLFAGRTDALGDYVALISSSDATRVDVQIDLGAPPLPWRTEEVHFLPDSAPREAALEPLLLSREFLQ